MVPQVMAVPLSGNAGRQQGEPGGLCKVGTEYFTIRQNLAVA